MTAITPDATLHALQSINPYQAAGPDGITPAVLKASAPQIAPVLASMFSRFLIMGRSPGPVCSPCGRGCGCGQEGFLCHVTSSMGTRKYLASLPNGREVRAASSTKV
ncbi:hypothetical protein HPB47_022234 [Ixodes persulcatus]|uniref:Uncharacterized protein n=1 Tax=Ixodes persulcatus TaxID=34615 RepID=A0AC60QAZ8_IXOPE|nr:hypothetical protein HPB47_022234 [Ixodes persulcatus]